MAWVTATCQCGPPSHLGWSQQNHPGKEPVQTAGGWGGKRAGSRAALAGPHGPPAEPRGQGALVCSDIIALPSAVISTG